MKREPHDALGPENLHELSVRIREHMGLYFTPERWGDLERGLRHAAHDFGFQGQGAVVQCAHWLLDAPLSQTQIDTLARHLTIGETYFFRDPPVFEALRHHVLPELVRARHARGEKTLRVWSAACCTGEEAYSLAILLMQALPALTPGWKEWNIEILGTDLNPHFLQKARAGVYSAWSFRDSARDEQSRFFRKTASGHFEISAEIRAMVKFAPLNLMTDHFPASHNSTSALDLIFCRNVLMYFQKEQARGVVEKLARCLIEGGFLAPSASEASAQLFAPLASTTWPGAIFYRKSAPATPDQITVRSTAGHAAVQTAPRRAVGAQIAPQHAALKAPSIAPKATSAAKTAPQAGTVQEWHARARRCANEGRLAEALQWCDRAIAADKMNARHHYLRASILMEQRVAQPDPSVARGNSGRAQTQAKVADGVEAEQALRRAIYLEPDFALAHFALGNLARRRGEAALARKSFNTALRLLAQADAQTPLAESEDLTAGHLAQIIAQALEDLSRQS